MENQKLNAEVRGLLSKSRNDETPRKDADAAENARKSGNQLFSRGSYDLAVEAYNEAIVLAPDGSKQLAITFANRAAVSAHQSKWRDCIDDLDLAFEFGTDAADLHSKWQQRRANAVKELKKSAKIREFKPQKLYNGEKTNVIGLSSAVDVVQDLSKGRKLIANVEIPAGALIIRDPHPLACEILPEFQTSICQNCCLPLRQSWVPCALCARPAQRFCNLKCRASAWSAFHRFECPMGFGFHSRSASDRYEESELKNSNARLLAQRILTTSNPPSIIQCDPQLDGIKSRIAKLGCDDQSDRIEANLLSAMTLMKKTNAETEISESAMTLFSSVARKEFLGQEGWPAKMKSAQRKALCCRMLNELCDRIRVNSWGIKVVFDDGNIRDVGSALYTTASLLNHSCLPNVCESFDGRVAEWRARQDIPAGTELCTTYCPHFGLAAREERIEHLFSGYGFRCDCAGCNDERYIKLEQDLLAFACVVCKTDAPENDNGEIVCGVCGRLPYFAQQVRDAADAIKQETARQIAAGNCEIKNVMQLMKKLDPMLGRRSELQFQLRATVAKNICEVHDKMAVAIIEQLLAQRRQHYADCVVMPWLNAIALSVHFMVDSRSQRCRELMYDEVRRVVVKTGPQTARTLLNATPTEMQPLLLTCFEKICEKL